MKDEVVKILKELVADGVLSFEIKKEHVPYQQTKRISVIVRIDGEVVSSDFYDEYESPF